MKLLSAPKRTPWDEMIAADQCEYILESVLTEDKFYCVGAIACPHSAIAIHDLYIPAEGMMGTTDTGRFCAKHFMYRVNLAVEIKKQHEARRS